MLDRLESCYIIKYVILGVSVEILAETRIPGEEMQQQAVVKSPQGTMLPLPLASLVGENSPLVGESQSRDQRLLLPLGLGNSESGEAVHQSIIVGKFNQASHQTSTRWFLSSLEEPTGKNR